MANGGLPQSIDVIRGRDWKTALDDHTVAFAGAAVTNGAIDIEALASTLKEFAGDWHRKSCDQIRTDFPGIECFVFMQLPARDGVGDDGTRGHLVVLKEIVSAERLAGGLIEHVAAAGGGEG